MQVAACLLEIEAVVESFVRTHQLTALEIFFPRAQQLLCDDCQPPVLATERTWIGAAVIDVKLEGVEQLACQT